MYIREGSAAIRPSVLYNSRWAHTCFVTYCTNACVCDLFTIVIIPFTTLRLGRGLTMWLAQLVFGARLLRYVLHHCDLSVAPL